MWSKKRILTVYLNITEFGDGIFGVEAAAQRYFHKPAGQLTPGEAALLAAVLPGHDPLSRRCAVGLCAQSSGLDLTPDATAGRGRVHARA